MSISPVTPAAARHFAGFLTALPDPCLSEDTPGAFSSPGSVTGEERPQTCPLHTPARPSRGGERLLSAGSSGCAVSGMSSVDTEVSFSSPARGENAWTGRGGGGGIG